jgi:hypothetical protein
VSRLWLVRDRFAGDPAVPELRRAPAVGRRGGFGVFRVSRYVSVGLRLRDLDEVAQALDRLGVALERPVDGVMLQGSLECPGEPVDLRVGPDAFDTVEDFGFVRRGDALVLVCGELDRTSLEAGMLPKLQAEVAALRLHRAAQATGTRVTTTVEVDGTRRIKLRRG